MSNQTRVQAGVPTGGQFAGAIHSDSGVSLAAQPSEPQTREIGVDLEPISAAQARRELPEGSTVQVVYLNGQRPGDDGTPDVRTVTKQTPYEMISATGPGTRLERGSTLGWAGNKAQRDAEGAIVISDKDGLPFVAYLPLENGADGHRNITVSVPAAGAVERAHLSDDPSELTKLAQSPLVAVQRSATTNAATPPEALAYLASSDDERVAENAVRHPGADEAVVEMAARHPHRDVRFAAAAHEKATAAVLKQMSTDPEYRVRMGVAYNSATPGAVLAKMGSTESDVDVQMALAANPNSSPDDLARWSRGHGNVRVNVAKNPSTPATVLERMARDGGQGNQIPAMVASNPSTPAYVVDNLVTTGDAWIREHAAKNPMLSEQHHGNLSRDPSDRVRRALAGNPKISDEAMGNLSRDQDSFVRAQMAKHKGQPWVELERLSRDDFHAVRASVAANPNTQPAVLRVLAKEESAHIGGVARERLARSA